MPSHAYQHSAMQLYKYSSACPPSEIQEEKALYQVQPPATEDVSTTRRTVSLLLATASRTFRVPFRAGSTYDRCKQHLATPICNVQNIPTKHSASLLRPLKAAPCKQLKGGQIQPCVAQGIHGQATANQEATWLLLPFLQLLPPLQSLRVDHAQT